MSPFALNYDQWKELLANAYNRGFYRNIGGTREWVPDLEWRPWNWTLGIQNPIEASDVLGYVNEQPSLSKFLDIPRVAMMIFDYRITQP